MANGGRLVQKNKNPCCVYAIFFGNCLNILAARVILHKKDILQLQKARNTFLAKDDDCSNTANPFGETGVFLHYSFVPETIRDELIVMFARFCVPLLRGE